MPVTILYSKDFLNHNTGINHPECPDRIRACRTALKKSNYSHILNWMKPRLAKVSELELIHSNNYITNIKNICKSGGGYLDVDTPVDYNSYSVALRSAGAWLDGIDQVMYGNTALTLSRPPGHHAETNKAMGFCIFSNAALSAFYALKQHKINKVLIFDWDVHHGNGTQEIIKYNSKIAYVSIHQYPFYPGTGIKMDSPKFSNILNLPVTAGCSRQEYLKIFNNDVIPFIKKFVPDLIIISAGFDAHRLDPLANLNLSSQDFSYMAECCKDIQPKILLGLEGGYNFIALQKCCISVVKKLI